LLGGAKKSERERKKKRKKWVFLYHTVYQIPDGDDVCR
jgi:hypothetical protein